MADILTAEQQAAVENRGRSLLVSACLLYTSDAADD